MPVAAAVVIDNVSPRRDQHGNILNAHDGHIITVNGTFWLFGTSYTHCLMTDHTSCLGTCGTMGGKCAYPISPDVIPNHPACGWTNNDFAAYSSTDLVSWRLENPSILPADHRSNGIYFRPKVMWNQLTRKFVLWMNFVTEGWDQNGTEFEHQHWSTLATAVSDRPEGPYSFTAGGHRPPIPMGTANRSYAHGDFGVFTDPDTGKGYIVYNAYDHRGKGQHSNSVDLLTDDFTASTGTTSGFFAEFVNGTDKGDEAQVMLKHRGSYFVIISQGCCFCSSGASAFVYTAPAPLGPFTLRNDIQIPAPFPSSSENRGVTIPAQQSFVLEIPAAMIAASHSDNASDSDGHSEQSLYMWGGDRWQSAPDHFKSHDFQAWVPFSFSEDGSSVNALSYNLSWSLPLRDTGSASSLKSDDVADAPSTDHGSSAVRGSRRIKLPYTPCGGSCTSDGFAAGGVPGRWVGTVCPAKCAECQSDGVIAPKRYNTSGSLRTNHYCESSPNSFYQHRTYSENEQFRVIVDGIGRDTTYMRDYTGRLEYVAFSLNYSHAVPAVGTFLLKPPHRAPKCTFSAANRTITFQISEPAYLLLQFNDSTAPLGGLLAIFAEAKPLSPLAAAAAAAALPSGSGFSGAEEDPGVVSVARWGVRPSERAPSAPGGQGDAIQQAIDEVMMPSSPFHTLVFPVGTYLTHDLHISNHSAGAKPVTIFLEDGVLLQRDGSHIGALTSPGFITIFNSSNVTLRGLGTLDALNGGQGLYISCSYGIVVDGLTTRNTWWWNTEIEHSHHIRIVNYKIPNDPLFPQDQNDGLNIEHSTHVTVDRLFVSTHDDLQCIKADPEDGFDQEGSWTPEIGEIRVSNMLGLNSGSISMKVGWGATCHRMYNVFYSHIDVASVVGQRPGTLIGVDPQITHKSKPALIANFSYSDVWHEQLRTTILIPVSYANVRNFTLRNVRGAAGAISLVGHSTEYNISGFHFHNVSVGGKLLASTQDLAKVVFASDVTFNPF